MKELTQMELVAARGGGITEESDVGYDLGYLVGWLGGAIIGALNSLKTPEGNWHSGMMGYSAG